MTLFDPVWLTEAGGVDKKTLPKRSGHHETTFEASNDWRFSPLRTHRFGRVGSFPLDSAEKVVVGRQLWSWAGLEEAATNRTSEPGNNLSNLTTLGMNSTEVEPGGER